MNKTVGFAKAELLKIRKSECAAFIFYKPLGNVPKSVTSHVAKCRRIGRASDPNGIEYEPHHLLHKLLCVTLFKVNLELYDADNHGEEAGKPADGSSDKDAPDHSSARGIARLISLFYTE